MTVAPGFRIFGCGVVTLALVAAFSGCGGSDGGSGSSADTTTSGVTTTATGNATALDGWASGLCQAIASWESTVKTTSAKIDNSQADFNSASQAISSANQALTGSLGGLGTPPAPASTEAKDAIDELSTNLQDESASIKQALNGNFSTQSQIATASARVRASISKMNASISKTVADLKALPDKEGWKKSFQQVPACKIVANT
jgi:septal ring factor EnvC (AmiA/AmiB activator)